MSSKEFWADKTDKDAKRIAARARANRIKERAARIAKAEKEQAVQKARAEANRKREEHTHDLGVKARELEARTRVRKSRQNLRQIITGRPPKRKKRNAW